MIHGFKLLKKEYVNEINSLVYLFKHKKTNAELIKIKNNDKNKAFSITFKTLPYSDNGIAHVLEHSVLMGSQKYPVRDLFGILMKGSMTTFINAYTGSDRTIYPFSSINSKEYYNLMDIYLDSVFNPLFYSEKNILKQEGWGYILKNRQDPLKINGIVYNEMKGELSSPYSQLWNYILHSLFPDTIYRYNSGGIPEKITELKYHDIIKFHKKYYHPSNSYIFLYGEGDLNEELKLINNNYLSKYNKKKINSKIKLQERFKNPVEKKYNYSISQIEEKKNKSFISINWMIDRAEKLKLKATMKIINNVLANSPAAVLKKKLIDKEWGDDFVGSFDSSMKQTVLSFILINTEPYYKNKFENFIYEELQNSVKNGLDKDLLKAAISDMEFNLREAEYNGYSRGIVYNFKILSNWLFRTNPLKPLKYESILKFLKKNINTGYFEEVIEKYLINNEHRSTLLLNPERGLLQSKLAEEEKKLKKVKDDLKEEELEELLIQTENLEKKQDKKIDAKELDKIPLLERKDLNERANKFPVYEENIHGIETNFYYGATNNIIYFYLYFDSSAVREKDIPYISLLVDLLEDLDTKNYSYDDLSNQIRINSGGISYESTCWKIDNNPDNIFPLVIVSTKVIPDKLERLLNIMGDILRNTKFDNLQRLKVLIRQIYSELKMEYSYSGESFGGNRLQSYLSRYGVYQDLIDGYSYYEFILGLYKNFESKKIEIKDKLIDVYERIFNINNMKVGAILEKQNKQAVRKNIKNLKKYLNRKRFVSCDYELKIKYKNEGVSSSSSELQYIYMGDNFKKYGYEFHGSMLVLNQIISKEYLYNKIRIKGGAYGTWSVISASGMFYLASYSDPNLIKTLKVFDDLPEYLKNLELTENELTRFIIGAISNFESQLSVRMKGEMAFKKKIIGITDEYLQKIKKEIISTNKDLIYEQVDMIKKLINNSKLFVYGNSSNITKNKEMFDRIINLS